MKVWVDELKSQGPKDILLAIVGNKTDLIDSEKVSYKEAQEYSRDNNAILKLVSAKEGKGINVEIVLFSNCLHLSPSSWI